MSGSSSQTWSARSKRMSCRGRSTRSTKRRNDRRRLAGFQVSISVALALVQDVQQAFRPLLQACDGASHELRELGVATRFSLFRHTLTERTLFAHCADHLAQSRPILLRLSREETARGIRVPFVTAEPQHLRISDLTHRTTAIGT